METENQNTATPKVEKTRTITLSPSMYKLGAASIVIGALLLLGSGAYSVYSYMHYKSNNEAVSQMQQSTEMQQEQLLTLSKKASSLNEELQNLKQMESELRLQAGLKPAKDTEKPEESTEPAAIAESSEQAESSEVSESPAANDVPAEGQGGPLDELKLADLNEALEILESNVKVRRESLEELQTELKTQREQMAVIVSIQSAAANNISSVAGQVSNMPVSQNAFAFGTASVSPSVPSIWPTTGVVTSPYGLRWGGSDFHPGMDIANDLGTPIVATADGVVEYAGWNSGGYGNMVDINHGNGIMTRYGHASQVVVSAGQFVKRGQVIALMGSTGFSTGPHVHYEVHVNGQRVNPISYL